MAGSKQALDFLHQELVAYLTDRLRAARQLDDDGNIKQPMAAAELGVLRGFLKDNGIAVDKNHADDLLELQRQLQSDEQAGNRESILADAVKLLAQEDDDGMMH